MQTRSSEGNAALSSQIQPALRPLRSLLALPLVLAKTPRGRASPIVTAALQGGEGREADATGGGFACSRIPCY